jgi:hypothetical protein
MQQRLVVLELQRHVPDASPKNSRCSLVSAEATVSTFIVGREAAVVIIATATGQGWWFVITLIFINVCPQIVKGSVTYVWRTNIARGFFQFLSPSRTGMPHDQCTQRSVGDS